MFCNCNDSMDCLSLYRLWTRKVVTFRTSDAFFQKLFLIFSNYIAVLGMHNTQSSQIASCLKGFIHAYIIERKGAFVSHEKLKTVNPVFDHLFHFAWSLLIPTGNCSMKSVVAIYLRVGPASPSVISYRHRLCRLRNCEIDERSCSSSKSCLTANVKVIHSICAHEGELHVSMSIDTAWD